MALTNKQYKNISYVILFIIVIGFNVVNYFQQDKSFNELDTNVGKRLVYTAHAKCRMGCRYIDKSEIDFIRKEGKINYRKSDMQDKPCPTIAKEGRTKDGQMVRIVFAECDRETKVVTAIDLEENHKCHCK